MFSDLFMAIVSATSLYWLATGIPAYRNHKERK